MEKYELSEAKQNAVRNILYDKISLECSCLTDVERTHLLLASYAYTVDPKSLISSKRLHGIMDVLHFKSHRFRAHRMRYFYELIKSIAAEGKKIHPERLQTLEVAELVKKGLNEYPSVSSISDGINEYKNQVDVTRKRYSELVEELIEIQRKESDEYFANKKPYVQRHNRRFDFEARNQPYTNEEFIEKLRAVYGDDYDYSEVNYTNSRTVIMLKCKKHGDVFERLPSNLLKGWGCPSCNKEQGKTWANTVACSYDPQRRSVRWTTKRFIVLQFLKAHLWFFYDCAIGSQAIEEVARVNVYCPCYLIDGGDRRVARNHLRHGCFGHSQAFCHLHGGEPLAMDGLHNVQFRNGSIRLHHLVSVLLYLNVYQIYRILCCL